MEDKVQDDFEDTEVATPTPAYESTYGGYENNDQDDAAATSGGLGLGLDKQMAVLGMTVSSLCAMLSSTKFYPDGNAYEVYALVSGVLMAVIGIIMLLVMRFAPDVANGKILFPSLSVLLAVYWTVASLVTTFKEPFAQLGNGYIAVYASTIFSVILVLEALPGEHRTRVMTSMKGANDAIYSADVNKRWVALCLVSSIVELIAGSIICYDYCDIGRGRGKLSGYAVACGVLSIVTCLVMLIDSVPNQIKNYCALYLAVWWTIALLALTFASSTFTVQNMNGYLGTWVSAIASFGLVIPLIAQFGWFGTGARSNEYDEVGTGYTDTTADQDNYDDYGHSSYSEGTGAAM